MVSLNDDSNNRDEERKANSLAAEKVKRDAKKIEDEKKRKIKDRARIDLNIKQGLLRSTEAEKSNLINKERELARKAQQIKFDEENHARREAGEKAKISDQETAKKNIFNDIKLREGVAAQKKRARQEIDAKIAEVKEELKRIELARELAVRKLSKLQGETLLDQTAQADAQLIRNSQSRITLVEQEERKLENEIIREETEIKKDETEYLKIETEIKSLKAKIVQLEANARTYEKEVKDLETKIR